jgi:hypothetical protein
MRREDGLPGYRPLPGSRRAADAEREAEVNARVAEAKARAQGAAPAAPEPVTAELKGAVKVEDFPRNNKYPFRAIADDGGVWKLDPSVFGAKPQSIRVAASKWGSEHGLKATTAADEGFVYVQFTKADG